MTMNTKADAVILSSFHTGRSLSAVLDELSASLSVEICLFSLSMMPILSSATERLEAAAHDVFSALEASGNSLYSSCFVLRRRNDIFAVSFVQNEGNRIGYIMLCASSDTPESDMRELAAKLAALCNFMTLSDVFSSSNNGILDVQISNILLNSNSNLMNLPTKINGYYAICAFSTEDDSPVSLKKAETNLMHFFYKPYHVIKKNMILLFLHDLKNSSEAGENQFETQIHSFSERFNLRCGISALFSKIEERTIYIEEAQKCLQMAEKAAEIVRADDNYVKLLFSKIDESWLKPALQLEQIRRIYDYDIRCGSAYFQTLRAYLNSQCHSVFAANELFIDHSTLNYRLKKIRELFDINFSSTREIYILRLALMYFEEAENIR